MNQFEAFRAIFENEAEPGDVATLLEQVVSARAQLGSKVQDALAERGVRISDRTISLCMRCAREWPKAARNAFLFLPTILAWRAPSYRIVRLDHCATCTSAKRERRPARTPAGAV